MKPSFSLAALAAYTFLMPVALTVPAHAQTSPVDLPTLTKTNETEDAFAWIIAPKVGSRWQMRTFTRTKSSQVAPGGAGNKGTRVESVVLQRLVADYDVLGRDQFGATTTRVTFRDMNIDAKVKVNGKEQPNLLRNSNGLRRAVNGAHFTIKQAPDGAIWNVMGVEALQKRLLNAVAKGDAATRQQLQGVSQSLFSPQAVRKMMSQEGTLPAYPIRAGESWAYGVELPVSLPVRSQIMGTRTVNLLTPDTAYISDDAVYSGEISDSPLETGKGKGNRLLFNMSNLEGGLLGTSRVNRASGLTMESTLAQRLGGTVIFKQLDSKGRVTNDQSVPIDIVTTGRVTLKPR